VMAAVGGRVAAEENRTAALDPPRPDLAVIIEADGIREIYDSPGRIVDQASLPAGAEVIEENRPVVSDRGGAARREVEKIEDARRTLIDGAVARRSRARKNNIAQIVDRRGSSGAAEVEGQSSRIVVVDYRVPGRAGALEGYAAAIDRKGRRKSGVVDDAGAVDMERRVDREQIGAGRRGKQHLVDRGDKRAIRDRDRGRRVVVGEARRVVGNGGSRGPVGACRPF